MKTVTIPTCANPFVVIVNGIKYTYPAGATVEVPDEVAEVIEQHEEAKPEPAPVLPPYSGGMNGDEILAAAKAYTDTKVGNIGGDVYTRQEDNEYIIAFYRNDGKTVSCHATYDESGRLAMVDVDGTVYYMP